MSNKKAKVLSLSLVAAASLYAGQSFAEGMPMDFYPSIQPVISVAGGVGISELGKEQSVTLAPGNPALGTTPVIYGYTPNKKNESTPFGQVFVGARWNYSPSISLQAGIMGFMYEPFKLSGTVDPLGLNAGFNSYDYNYKIRSMGIMLDTKIIWNASYKVHPFISAAAGISENKSESFRQTVLPGAILLPLSSSNYSSKSRASFAYMLGLGVNLTITRNFEATIGYQYADLGKSELGLGPNAATSETLSLNDIVVNQGYIALSYIGDGHIT